MGELKYEEITKETQASIWRHQICGAHCLPFLSSTAYVDAPRLRSLEIASSTDRHALFRSLILAATFLPVNGVDGPARLSVSAKRAKTFPSFLC